MNLYRRFRGLAVCALLACLLCITAQADTLSLPEKLTVIDASAFENDAALDEVLLPDGALRIEGRAFANSGVKRIYLPTSLRFIADDAFLNCENMIAWGEYGSYAETFCAEHGIDFEAPTPDLKDLTIEYISDTEAVITGYTGTEETLYLPAKTDATHVITAIGEGAFKYKKIKYIMLPAGLRRIEKDAFSGCSSLEAVDFNDQLEYIGKSAFSSCGKLTEALLPDSVTTIEDAAFMYCRELTYFNYPAALSQVGKEVFYQCTSLISAEIPNDIKNFQAIFNCCDTIQEVILPGAIDRIPYRAFYKCYALKTIRYFDGQDIIGEEGVVTLPPRVRYIDQQAFGNCSSICDVAFSEGLQSIGRGVFEMCDALLEADLPDSVGKIDSGAFNGCEALERFLYPKGLCSVGVNGILCSCPSLKWVEVPDGVTELLAVFSYNAYIETVILPNTLTSIDNDAFYRCTSLKNVLVAGGLSPQEGVNMVQLPPQLVKIGSYAFSNCPEIELLICNEGLQQINFGAFQICTGLREVRLNKDLVKIDGRGFYGCSSLETLYVPASVTEIGSEIIDSSGTTVIESEYGAPIINYCVQHGYPYRYISQQGLSCSEAVYQTVNGGLEGMIYTSSEMLDVRLTLISLDTGETAAEYAQEPHTQSLDAAELMAGIDLETLPMGIYRILLNVTTADGARTLLDQTVNLRQEPLQLELANCTLPAVAIDLNDRVSMQGTMTANMPMDSVTASIIRQRDNKTVSSYTVTPHATSCDLGAIAEHLSPVMDFEAFRFTLTVTGNEETITAVDQGLTPHKKQGVYARDADNLMLEGIDSNLKTLATWSAYFAYDTYVHGNKTLNDMGSTIAEKRSFNNRTVYTSNGDVGRYVMMWKDVRNADGNYTRVWAIGIQGTEGTPQWIDNLNVGTGEYHAGFLSLARLIKNDFTTYRQSINRQYPKPNGENYLDDKVWICGHSRGAAAANILGGDLLLGSAADGKFSEENIYCFCFACPNVSKGSMSAYNHVKNYLFDADVVPRLPLRSWGYTRYGVIAGHYSDSTISTVQNERVLLTTTDTYTITSVLEDLSLTTDHVQIMHDLAEYLTNNMTGDESGKEKLSKLVKAIKNVAEQKVPVIALIDLMRGENFITALGNTHDSWTYYQWMNNEQYVKIQ